MSETRRELGDQHPRIVFFGLFGIGNFGNDASLEAALGATRRLLPEARITVVCGDPDDVRDRYSVDATSMFPVSTASSWARRLPRMVYLALVRVPAEPVAWVRAFRSLEDGDHVIVPGTGILDDFGTGPGSVPLAMVRWFMMARLRGLRISLLSVGAGPIHDSRNRTLLKLAARLAHDRSFRDRESRAFMIELGVDAADDPVTPDLAFSLTRCAERSHREHDPLVVGIGVMNYRGWTRAPRDGERIYEAYVGRVTGFVRWLLDRGYRVRLLAGDVRDHSAAQDVLARLDRETRGDLGVKYVDPCGSLRGVIHQLRSVDIVCASRFHTVIAALICCRPVLAIGYESKFDHLMAAFGVESYCQRIESLDVALLKRQFIELLSEAVDVRQRMAEMNEEYTARLDGQYERILRGAAPR